MPHEVLSFMRQDFAPFAPTLRPMSDSQVNVGAIVCQLSNLTVFTANAQHGFSETVLQGHQPFSLQVTVEFAGPGAIALMPLSLAVQVEFYTKPLGPESGMILGTTALHTQPDVLTYAPTLALGSPLSVGLKADTIYRVGAVLRVGAPKWPSLVNGFTEELTIEIYTSPAQSGKK